MINRLATVGFTLLILFVIGTGSAEALDDASASGTRRAIIMCGHPGDADHRKQFGETIDKIVDALTTRLGFQAANIAVLFGGDQEGETPSIKSKVRGPSTRESIENLAKGLSDSAKPDDALWVIVLGHAHYDRRFVWWNLPGPDLQQHEFATLFQGLPCSEQVFFITTPLSGFFIRPLSTPGRVVIAATEADQETNETLYPHILAQTLSAPPAKDVFDVDKDGDLSLLDLYLVVARQVAQRYVTDELLATEHGQIDDDGDGKGSELQIDYLTDELGGRAKTTDPPKPVTNGDGLVAARILLPPGFIPDAAVTASETK